MAFGIHPHFEVDLSIDNLTEQQFLALTVDLARQLDWTIHFVSDRGFIAYTGKNLFVSQAEIRLRLDTGLAHVKSQSIDSKMTDGGKNKKNIQDFLALFDEQKARYTAEELDQKYEEIRPLLAPPDQDQLSLPPAGSKEKFTGFLSFFIPREGYFITPILINLNILVYLIMVLSGVDVFEPTSGSLLRWGANFKPSTLDGEWWRLITCCFIHIGLFHLLLNMYALMYIGLLLEPYLGRLRFAIAYLLTGIASSLTSLYWHDLTLSAGASGAIFGMYGLFLAMLTTNLIPKEKRGPLLTSIGIFVGYNLVYGMKGSIDSAAHIGGLISGLLIGYLFYPGLRQPGNLRLVYSTLGIAVLLTLTTSILAYKKMPNDIVIFEKNMDAFGKLEKTALSVYELSSDDPKDKWLTAIKNKGLYNWNKSIELLEESNKLKVPAEWKQRTTGFIEYCNLRIASYNYLYKKIGSDGNTGSEIDSTEYYKTKIDEIIHSLNNEK